MNISRPVVWLLAFLLLVGQQAGLLHHLDHDLAGVRVVVADGGAGLDGQGLPESDRDAGVCVLCIGFGGAAASLPEARFEAPLLALDFARPVPDAPILRPAALAGTPIRGPPQDFSSLA